MHCNMFATQKHRNNEKLGISEILRLLAQVTIPANSKFLWCMFLTKYFESTNDTMVLNDNG